MVSWFLNGVYALAHDVCGYSLLRMPTQAGHVVYRLSGCLVHLVTLVYLVCLVYLISLVYPLVWFNHIHETDQINQTDPIMVFGCWRSVSVSC